MGTISNQTQKKRPGDNDNILVDDVTSGSGKRSTFADLQRGFSGFAVDSISSMTSEDTSRFTDGEKIAVRGFYPGTESGGGFFYWDSSEAKSNHNGGTVINPDHLSTIGSANWYSSTGDSTDDSGSGCWKRTELINIDIKKFGAKGDGATDDINAINAAKYAVPTDGRLVFNGSSIISSTISFDKDIIFDFTSGGVVVNSDIIAIQTRETANNHRFIGSFDTTAVNVDGGVVHTKDLVQLRGRFVIDGCLAVANAGANNIHIKEAGSSNHTFSNGSFRVDAAGGNGLRVSSTKSPTNLNAMNIEVLRSTNNDVGVYISEGIGNSYKLFTDLNTNEGVKIDGGSKHDVFIYEDSSNGARVGISGGGGFIRGHFGNGTPSDSTDSYIIQQGNGFVGEKNAFYQPFVLDNPIANNISEGIRIPFSGSSGTAELDYYEDGGGISNIKLTPDILRAANEFRHEGSKLGFFATGSTTKPTALTPKDTSTVDGTYGTEEQNVIENNRTRVEELEQKLQALGLIS